MTITKDEVIHVAKLARLKLDAAAVDRFAGQIDQILGYMDILNTVDTSGVSPTSHAISMTNVFREDVLQETYDRKNALANAPEKDAENFLVPKVVG